MYFEVSASCSAFSSSSCLASSISRFLPSTCVFCVVSWLGLGLQLLVGLLQLLLLLLEQLLGRLERGGLLLQPGVGLAQLLLLARAAPRPATATASAASSVRMLAAIVLSTMAIVSVSWSSRVRWMSLKWWNEASSMTALTCPSKSTGRTTMFSGRRLAQAGADPDVVARHVGDQDPLLLEGALADQPLADRGTRLRRPLRSR